MLPNNREPAIQILKAAPMGEILLRTFRSLTGVPIENARPGVFVSEGVRVAHVNETVRVEEAQLQSGVINLTQAAQEHLGVMMVARRDYSLLQVLDQNIKIEDDSLPPLFRYEYSGFNEDGNFVDESPVYTARMNRLPKRYGRDSVEARVYDIAHETIVTAYDELEGHRRSFFYSE